jgi:hypothetical protein
MVLDGVETGLRQKTPCTFLWRRKKAVQYELIAVVLLRFLVLQKRQEQLQWQLLARVLLQQA